jgi:hypothetical protein
LYNLTQVVPLRQYSTQRRKEKELNLGDFALRNPVNTVQQYWVATWVNLLKFPGEIISKILYRTRKT